MQFRFKAISIDGKEFLGCKRAKNEKELLAILKSEGFYCLSYKKKSQKGAIEIFNKASNKEISLFSKYMYTSLKAGINICDVLNLISSQVKNKKLYRALSEIKGEIESGNSLSDALNKFQYIFPSFFRNMVLLGEESGKLQQIFLSLENYYNSLHKRKSKIKNALIYPLFLFFFSILVVIVMITKILPAFITQITSLGGKVPNITKIYMYAGNALNNYGLLIIALLGILAIILLYFSKAITSKIRSFQFISKIPLIGSLIKKNFLTRFSSAMYLLLDSGIDIISALNIFVNCNNNNNFFNEKLRICINNLENGSSISNAFQGTEIFPQFFISMMCIGEENGNIDNMLVTANNIFEEDLNLTIERYSALFEPVLILIIGVFVGSIVLSIMIPLFNLSSGGL
jgi:type IV pilus assembly protein PilC